MVLAAALVAAQPLFDANRGLLGAVISVGRHSLGFEQSAGIQMQHAFCAKAKTVLANGGMPGIAAAEIFLRRLLDTIGDPLLQSHADTDVSSRYAQRHEACLLVGRGPRRAIFPPG